MGLDLSRIGFSPSIDPNAIAAAIQDPHKLLVAVELQTRLGSFTVDPNSGESAPGGQSGGSELNAVGKAIVRFLQPTVVLYTAVGPITVPLTAP